MAAIWTSLGVVLIATLGPTMSAGRDNDIHTFFKQSANRHPGHWGRFHLGAPAVSGQVQLPEEQWFIQYLDHFRPTDNRMWKQRFWVNDTFYQPGGPAFIMIGGEGTANPIWMVEGAWIDYAKEFKAICFQLEHRFYGESQPTEDLTVKNLKYLSSEQALADLANFITSMNERHNLTLAPWIAFGGSYPGSLAAWLRLKYPHLVHAAVSTSGPLVAKADFPEYLDVVTSVLDLTDAQCRPNIHKALEMALKLVNHRMGWNLLNKFFRLCDPFNGTNSDDVSNFFENIVGHFEGVIQYNRDNREFEGVTTANITIDLLCHMMSDSSNAAKASPLQRLANLNSFMLNATGQSCLDYSYNKMIQDLRSTSWNSTQGSGGRQWLYQTCTEFGWYQSSSQVGSPYTSLFPLAFFEKQCADIFGPNFSPSLIDRGIKKTNTKYGGKDIHVTNVIFVHGNFDPWHALGITKDLSDHTTAILIPGTAHCANMYPARPEDPPQLTDARMKIKHKIQQWIGEPSNAQIPIVTFDNYI